MTNPSFCIVCLSVCLSVFCNGRVLQNGKVFNSLFIAAAGDGLKSFVSKGCKGIHHF